MTIPKRHVSKEKKLQQQKSEPPPCFPEPPPNPHPLLYCFSNLEDNKRGRFKAIESTAAVQKKQEKHHNCFSAVYIL